ncbi:MAG: insulinase family protein [Tagaea sp.]|nr:insulinase family protein [Tagaea sp.]
MSVFVRVFLVAFALILAAPPAGARNVVEVRSPGGIVAWFVRDPSLPVLAIEFSWRGGSAADPIGKGGLASMTADLLTAGAGDLDLQAFAREIEDRSISIGFSAGADTAQGSLRLLSRDADRGVELLALALTRPRFDAREVERVRAQILQGLARDESSPETQARRAFARAAFGDHPYARPGRGTPDSVRSLTVEDLRAHLARRYARDNLVVAAVGDVTPERLGLLLDRAFGGLPASAAPVEIPRVEAQGAGRTLILRKPATQTFALFGHKGVAREDPDFFAAQLVNYVLGGGGFNSRLMARVREREGLTYGIGTGLGTLDRTEVIQGSFSSENGRIARAMDIVREEWTAMGARGLSAEELQGAKDYLTGSFPLQLDRSDRIARLLVNSRLDGRGLDWFDERQRRIEAVTLAQANAAARRLFDPARLLVVLAGEPQGIAGTE